MFDKPINVLLVEDNPGDVRLVREVLKDAGQAEFAITSVDRLRLAFDQLTQQQYDLVLLDLTLPDSHDIATFDKLNKDFRNIPVIILTGMDDEKTAVEAVRQGAQDYIMKGMLDGPALARAMVYAIERKRSNERIRRLNRLYSVLTKANEATVRIRDINQLYEETCRIIIEHGMLCMAWVGVVDPASSTVVPVARWGAKTDILDRVRISCDDTFGSRGPSGTALKRGAPVVNNDLITSEAPPSWRILVTECGFKGCAIFPFRADDRQAVICMYVCHTDFFDEEMVELLESLAVDLSYAVDSIKHEERRREAERALMESERRFHDALANLDSLTAVQLNTEGTIVFCNDFLLRLTGWNRNEVIGGNWFAIFGAPNAREQNERSYKALLSRYPEQTGDHSELRIFTKTGDLRLISSNTTILSDPAGNPIGISSIGEDITEQRRIEQEMILHNLELGILNSVLATISDTTDLHTIADRLSRLLENDWGFESGRISACDDVPCRLQQLTNWGSFFTDLTGQPDLLRSIAAEDLKTMFDNVSISAPPVAPDMKTSAVSQAPDETTCIRVPLSANGEIVGLLELHTDTTSMLHENRERFYKILGQQVGIAFHKSRLYEELRLNHERLRNLSRQLVSVQENERRRVALELHDGIGALVTALSLTLTRCSTASEGDAGALFAQAESIADELTSQVREISLQLRPTMLDDLGLLPALHWYFRRFTAQTSVRVLFEHENVWGRFGQDIETAVFRIAQEALTNVARHAQASEVSVSISANESALTLNVTDRGLGFDVNEAIGLGTSCGLTGMRERASLVGGNLMIDSTPGRGTTLSLVIPIGE
jgi:PAS domain S-box-containing protein